MQRLSDLYAAALPFVTRSLRGARWRRLLVLSGALGLLSIVLGYWIAQGTGSIERELRQELQVEDYLHERERREFNILAQHEWQLQDAMQEREALLAMHRDEPAIGWSQMRMFAAEAYLTAQWAATGEGFAATLPSDLRRRAAELVAEMPHLAPLEEFDHGLPPIVYEREHAAAWVETIVAHRLVPAVQPYASPLDAADTVRVIGLAAGAALAVLMLLVAPLMVGVQMANEIHENTLQPLTGTALTTRQLVLGLACGPLAVVGVLAVPQAIVLAGAMLLAGHVITGLAFFATLVCTSLLLVALAQLFAIGMGKRRSPGMVAVTMLVTIGALAITGMVAGLSVEYDIVGIVATLPIAGAAHLWSSTFLPMHELSARAAFALDVRLVVACVGFVVLGAFAQLAIERRVVARPEGLLRRHEAAMAAAVVVGLSMLAIPPSIDGLAPIYLGTLVMIVAPLQILLMARVPGGDTPPAMRTIRLSTLLGEYACVLAVHLVVAIAIARPGYFADLSFGGVLHLTWALVVAALVSIRGVVAPISLATKVWLGVCLVCVLIQLGVGAALLADGPRHGALMPIEHMGALGGLVYLGLFFWVPVSVARSLVSTGARLR